ncbi:TolC family protein [Cesiribacter sp. SM1]|uniref:TolC family protein n=1 Tax=Cesiribacter sp. SM1 TaxID=2861196 RepID=UPI001CD61842|nr:TolC family protein [Cesiribacter sp. SM1]
MKRKFLLLVLLCSGLVVHAQQIQDQQLAAMGDRISLQEAVEYAWRNNIQVRQSQLQVQASEIDYLQSRLGRLPTLNGQATHGYNFGRSVDPFTNQYTTDPIRYNSFSFFSSVDVFAGFQAHNQIKARYAELEAARQDAAEARNIVGLQVTDAYLQVLLTQELAAIARLQVNTSQEQLNRTRIQVEAGSLPQANLYDVESQLAADEVSAVNAENNLELAKLNLLQSLQLPGGQNVEVEPIEIDMSGLQLTTTSPQEIYAVALENQPQIRAANNRQDATQYSLQAAKGALMPSLALSGNITTQYSSIGTERDVITMPDFLETPAGYVQGTDQVVIIRQPNTQVVVNEIPFWDQLDLNRRGSVSINLNIPVFNNYQARRQVGLARIQSRSADLELERIKNQLRSSIEQSYADARAAAKRYAALQKQVESLELAFRNAEIRREVGSISTYDFTFAKNNLDRARAELAQAKYNYVFSLKVIDFYLGNPLTQE